jgi:bifunctional non-homologous end joining protein LigD
MSLRPRTLPAGFIEPCLPTSTKRPPSGKGWLHEIKHDGFRLIARKNGNRVRLYSRPGNDLTRRFPRITEAVARLRARTCVIDGEAVACGPDGIACFDLIRDWGNDEKVFLRAFDLIELNGEDLRRESLMDRKASLVIALVGARDGIELNDHMEHEDAALVFQHACKLGFEGIISKRKASPYRSGRLPDWIKLKKAPAVKREAEEDWRK